MNEEMDKFSQRLSGLLGQAALKAPTGPDPAKVAGALRRRTAKRRVVASAGGLAAALAVVTVMILHRPSPVTNPPPSPRHEPPQVAGVQPQGLSPSGAFVPSIDFPSLRVEGLGAEGRVETSLPSISLSEAPRVSSPSNFGQISFPTVTMSGL